MSLNILFSHNIYVWLVLPILIFIGGLAYVSLGTLRIIFVARGQRFLSPLLGFFEGLYMVAEGAFPKKNLFS